MKKVITILVIILVIIIIGVGLCIWYINSRVEENNQPSGSTPPSPIAEANYICNEGKTIAAAFYKGEPKPVEPGQPPIPTGSVKIVLSDGRSFDLAQTISADGSRYANSDESFVFWSRGNGALVLENNEEKSYIGCIVEADDPGGLPKVYSDGVVGFSIRYPADYSLNASYKYQALGPGKDISGVKFTIPASLTTGTNLSSFDTGVSVEFIPAVQDCKASLFLGNTVNVQTITDNNIEYSFASTAQGAAGNIYEENVWAIMSTNPCIAVRYFIHSTNIGNYPTGSVVEFDKASLINQFDSIRHTLITL